MFTTLFDVEQVKHARATCTCVVGVVIVVVNTCLFVSRNSMYIDPLFLRALVRAVDQALLKDHVCSSFAVSKSANIGLSWAGYNNAYTVYLCMSVCTESNRVQYLLILYCDQWSAHKRKYFLILDQHTWYLLNYKHTLIRFDFLFHKLGVIF